jgi:hypothetical protein
MVHGFGASVGHWKRNIPALTAAGYQVSGTCAVTGAFSLQLRRCWPCWAIPRCPALLFTATHADISTSLDGAMNGLEHCQ